MNDLSFKQPPSLRVFFATEMWERYGFYVVQSLLALYLAMHFKWYDKEIYALVGSFTALTYLSPIVGGWIADHLLGQKRTILTGAVFLFFSYINLTLIDSDLTLIAALAGVCVGTGLLKPNISSLLGNEYTLDSPKRESGFTIFYMGITLGIILGTTIPSQLNNYFGWPASFGSAAFGMIIAFLVFYMGVKRYQIADYHPSEFQWKNLGKALLLMALLWLISFCILFYPRLADISFGAVVIVAFIYLIYTIRNESAPQSYQTIVIGLLCIISALFWAFYFQMFMSLTLFISRVVEPKLFGIFFPPPYYVSIQSLGMLIFGFYISRRVMPTLNSNEKGIRTTNKFLMAMFFTIAAYVLIAFVSHNDHRSNALLSPLLFIPAYLLLSLAELFLSPVGLAAITFLASRRKVSTMMGIFFVSLGIGAYLSGKLANLTAINPDHLTVIELKLHYAAAFTELLIILVVGTLICLILKQIIKKLLLKPY